MAAIDAGAMEYLLQALLKEVVDLKKQHTTLIHEVSGQRELQQQTIDL